MEPISNPLLSLFIEPDIEVLYRQRNEAIKIITEKFALSRELVAEIKFNGRFEAIGIVLLGWCVDGGLADKACERMKTQAERSSFAVLINYFRKGIKNIYSTNKLVVNPLAPSVNPQVADSMIVTHILAEMIFELFLLHMARFGADIELG